MADEQIITCGDGITLRATEDGTGLCSGDCGPPPSPCCDGPTPPPCGKRWMVCFSAYSYEQRIRIEDEYYGTVENITSEDINGGPFAYNAEVDAFGCSTNVNGMLPIVRVEEVISSTPSPESTRRVEYFCISLRIRCGIIAGDSCFGSQSALIQAVPVSFVAGAAGGLRRPVIMDNCEPGTRPIPNGTETVTRSYDFRAGNCAYDETTSRVETEIVFDPFRPEIPPHPVVRTTTERVRVRYILRVLEDCAGQTFSPCAGSTPTQCTDDQQYIPGLSCVGDEGPPVVFPAENVHACRIMRVAGHCYRVSPNTPRVPSPGGATVDYRVVTPISGFSTCCACIEDCANGDLPSYPCWQNAFRDGEGVLQISPSFVPDDACCCGDEDVITIALINGELTIPGDGTPNNPTVIQTWRLRDGPIVFRRGDAGFSQLVWSVVTTRDASDPNGPPLFPPGNHLHGEFTNDPPMGCQWRGFVNIIDFRRPAELASAQPVGANVLPCPGEPDPPVGQWRIRVYSIAATCDEFTYDAVYDGPGGMTFHALTRVTVRRPPEADLMRCGGGCSKSVPIVGDFPIGGPRGANPLSGGRLFFGDGRNIIGGGG